MTVEEYLNQIDGEYQTMIIEQYLTDRIRKLDNEINGTKDHIQKLRVDIAELEKIKESLYTEMRRVCEHPQDKVKKTLDYCEGGYLNTSTSTYTWTCTQCNKEIKKVTEQGTYA